MQKSKSAGNLASAEINSAPDILRDVLLVDDDTALCKLITRYVNEVGRYTAHVANNLEKARQLLATQSFDIAFLDHRLPDGHGIDLIADLRAVNPDMAVLIITGVGDIPLAVEAMQRGADHFLTKPIKLPDLSVFLDKCEQMRELRRQSRVQERLRHENSIDFGSSASMRSVLEQAGRAAATDSPLLITGESGVGKGVLARWVHDRSARRKGPFVALNCASLQGDLLASELFGHAKGAFTSAVQDRMGLIEAAEGGTLFLDEIGDMDISVQAKFLTVIEEKAFRRIGEVRERKSDFRVICATNQDLQALIAAKRFRQDLLYRVKVLAVSIPPLRERREDLPGLVQHLLLMAHYRHRDVTPRFIDVLQAHAWPGNVRELRNVLEQAMLAAQGGRLEEGHIPFFDHHGAIPAGESGTLQQLEMQSIRQALDQCAGDIERAARQLGISRSTLYRRLKNLS